METDEFSGPGYFRFVARSYVMPPDIRKESWALMERFIYGPGLTDAELERYLDIKHRYDPIVSEDEVESFRLGFIKHSAEATETVLLRRLTLRERAEWADPGKRQKLIRRRLPIFPVFETIEEIVKRMALEKAGLLSNGHAPH